MFEVLLHSAEQIKYAYLLAREHQFIMDADK